MKLTEYLISAGADVNIPNDVMLFSRNMYYEVMYRLDALHYKTLIPRSFVVSSWKTEPIAICRMM